MPSSLFSRRPFVAALAFLAALPATVSAGNIISTTGFSSCSTDPTVNVTALNVSYDKSTRQLTFDVAGESSKEQNVSASLIVSAYGKQVFTKTFNPCDPYIKQMCPIPAGTFAANGAEPIPEEYASEIPSIVFDIPDLDANVKLELTSLKTKEQVGCISSSVGNGKTLQMPAIKYVAGGIALGALALSGVAALASGGHPGASTSSPTFTETIGWFQGMATTGMLSVQYPQVYLSWTSNFAFSTGLVSWGSMQNAIDGFRASTGGNLTHDNYQWLENNVTLLYDQGNNSSYSITPRSLASSAMSAMLWARQDGASVNVNGTKGSIGNGDAGSSDSSGSGDSKNSEFVSGIKGYVTQLSIPQGSTFMTVLLIFAIVIAAIIVLILLFKVILEGWTLIGKLPKYLESWRKRYWWRMAKAITNLVFLLYGTWTLYCLYQFTNGDSWAATILAAITFSLFTALLAWFTWRIYTKAHEFKKMDGDAKRLYEDKETWIKYSLFYDNYKKDYYMFFVPMIIYMFAKGCIIAGGDGHGLVQAGGQLILEAIFVVLLLVMRPHQRKSGRWINIVIQIIRMLSVACVLVFVEELGISQTTKTITGVVLIIVQATLTVVLALLIAINSLITCIRENPHSRRRRAQQADLKADGAFDYDDPDTDRDVNTRDLDALTPLDARNSLLMEPMTQHRPGVGVDTEYKPNALVYTSSFGSDANSKGRYDPVPPRDQSPAPAYPYYSDSRDGGSGRPTPPPGAGFAPPRRVRTNQQMDDERTNLVSGAARMGRRQESFGGDVSSRSPSREPRLPDLDFGFGHGSAGSGGFGIAR